MQAAKDTFLKTFSGRLAAINPARTVTMDGVVRPAALVLENETQLPADAKLETFLLCWEGAGQAVPGIPLMYVDCKLSYGSRGTDEMLRADRGRILTAMDSELLRVCELNRAAKCDYTITPPAVLGSNIFWTRPVMETPSELNGVLQRAVTIRLFFFPEVA